MAFYWQVSKLVALPVVTGGGVDSEVKTMHEAIEAAGVDLKKRRPFGVMGVTSKLLSTWFQGIITGAGKVNKWYSLAGGSCHWHAFIDGRRPRFRAGERA